LEDFKELLTHMLNYDVKRRATLDQCVKFAPLKAFGCGELPQGGRFTIEECPSIQMFHSRNAQGMPSDGGRDRQIGRPQPPGLRPEGPRPEPLFA
jgi:hypothetical protein